MARFVLIAMIFVLFTKISFGQESNIDIQKENILSSHEFLALKDVYAMLKDYKRNDIDSRRAVYKAGKKFTKKEWDEYRSNYHKAIDSFEKVLLEKGKKFRAKYPHVDDIFTEDQLIRALASKV